MKSHDELMEMTDEERGAYLILEVEKIITSAPPHSQLKLRALQARIDGIRNRNHDPYKAALEIYDLMMVHFGEMNRTLNGD